MKTLLALAMIVALSSCSDMPERSKPTRLYWQSIESIEGHEYIIITSMAYGGVSIIHAEHCQCNQPTTGEGR